MKNNQKKIFRTAFLLIMMFLVVSLLTPYMPLQSDTSVAYASESADSNYVTELQISNYEQFYKSIAFYNNNLIFTGIPNDGEHNFLWLILKDSSGNTAFDSIQGAVPGGNASFNLGSLSDGTYTIYLYHNSQRYSSYSSDIYRHVSFTKENGESYFILPKTAAINAKHFASNRNEKNVLNYYLKPSSYTIQSDDSEIKSQAEAITSGLTSDYEKCLAIHDWVADNIYYNYDAFYGNASYGDTSAKGVLQSKKSVCEGYANLTVALLRASGIPAKKVSGYALGLGEDNSWKEEIVNDKSRTNHAWVEAYADERWITMDPTWDSGNNWENGKAAASDGCYRHLYFDICSDFLSYDHVVRSNDDYLEYSLVDDTKIKVESSSTKVSGKKAIKLSWTVSGEKLDGFEIYKSTKKSNIQYYYYNCTVTKFKNGDKRTYTNSKNLKPGKKYYFAVRGYKIIDGTKYYTPFSNIVYRTV